MSKKQPFTIVVWYFKPSGKFYTEASFNREFAVCGDLGDPTCYMADVAAHIRGLRDNGGQGALPGLCSNGWDGPILVNCEEGFPVLILPNK